MATVQDKLDDITSETGYVTGSLINKSFNDDGATYKYLHKIPSGAYAFRKEVFIPTSTSGTPIEDRTATDSVPVQEAI